MTTPIIIRQFKQGQFKGDFIALFPNIPADMQGWYVVCYELATQHGSADYRHIVHETKLAEPSEQLLQALKNAGYDDLKFVKKQTPKHRKEIADEIAKIKYK
jgi:hypothetical protein